MASVFKLRYENKTYNLVSTQQSTVEELMAEIRDQCEVMPSRQQIMFGYPQKTLPTDSESLSLPLSALGVQKREMFTLVKKDPSSATAQGQTNQAGPKSMKSRFTEAIKIPIPSDNSCLFNSIAYLCTGSSNRGIELRNYCIEQIKQNPTVYTAAMLGCEPAEYCRWISRPDHWGGYIEMNILSKLYNVEICVLYIEESKIVPVNSCNAKKRIYILYDNIHYDSIVFKGFGYKDEVKVIDADDAYAEQLALDMARTIKAAGGYTNTKTAMLKCDDCGKIFKGQNEAEVHLKATGHFNYSQVNI
ncbi:aminotransferase [Tritrichomonas musculus]|uniref:Ubiquitin thioesterase OTU n=1 Tax=Tritrichomonas musculus TaxID=1915356 RepID=A0ABR2H994_9EUKA